MDSYDTSSTKGAFRRPVRLTPREALCVTLALRCQGAAAEVADLGSRKALLEPIEQGLTHSVDHDAFACTDDLDPRRGRIRQTLLRAARERQPSNIEPGERRPGKRRIRP
jgi:hypothetical protein